MNVAIRDDKKKDLIFGLARLPAAHVLAFFGYKHESLYLMQVLCHRTRAYIWNANALDGFL